MDKPKKYIRINPSCCKGCQFCIDACKNNLIELDVNLNELGYRFARFNNPENACTACGLCFYVCPEPDSITVYKEPRK